VSRVKKGKCDGKKPVCTRCALDGQMCMFSERKFSKDRVIPKGYYSLKLLTAHCFRYVELLENRVDILETGLREALLRLNASGGFQLPHSPASNPPSPTASHFLDHSHDLTCNITQALKELQAMKVEREKEIYSDHEHEHDDHSDHGDTGSRRDSAESTHTMSSAKIEDLATPLTSPSNSPPPKALFLPSELAQPPLNPQYTDSNINFYQAYYDRQISNTIPTLNLAATGQFAYDELSLSWLDSVAMDDTYGLSLQNNEHFAYL